MKPSLHRDRQAKFDRISMKDLAHPFLPVLANPDEITVPRRPLIA